MWHGIVGRAFSPSEFDQYVKDIKFGAWRPSFVVLHNTAPPTLAQRPQGLLKQHILNLEQYYKEPAPGKPAWNSGPHLFIDDIRIWVFSPLTARGTHTPSWNTVSLGVEMLGDYETESFTSGRGALVASNTVAALATLHAVFGLDSHTLKLHREDPHTTHRECPGKNVDKDKIIKRVHDLIVFRHAGEHTPAERPL